MIMKHNFETHDFIEKSNFEEMCEKVKEKQKTKI